MNIYKKAIEQRIEFLNKIGAIFEIEFDGETYKSDRRFSNKAPRNPWAETGFLPKVKALEIGDSFSVEPPKFSDVGRTQAYLASAACYAFGKGACLTEASTEKNTVTILRVE